LGDVQVVTRIAQVPFDFHSAIFRAEWEDHVSRALRAGGRMHLVVMLVPVGRESQYRGFDAIGYLHHPRYN
jgi:hypothetical protein